MSDIITVTGNIATDPEFQRRPNELAIARFRLASTERRFDKATQRWVDGHTNWYSVSAFRSLAEHVDNSLSKGDRVIVTGRLRLRAWENGDRKGLAVEIDADAVGHDLRWGTTRYTPARERSAASGNGQGETDDWAVHVEGEGAPVDERAPAQLGAHGEWTVPGAGANMQEHAQELVTADANVPF